MCLSLLESHNYDEGFRNDVGNDKIPFFKTFDSFGEYQISSFFSLTVSVQISKGEQNDVNMLNYVRIYITTCISKTSSLTSSHTTLIYQIEGSKPKPHQIL